MMVGCQTHLVAFIEVLFEIDDILVVHLAQDINLLKDVLPISSRVEKT